MLRKQKLTWFLVVVIICTAMGAAGYLLRSESRNAQETNRIRTNSSKSKNGPASAAANAGQPASANDKTGAASPAPAGGVFSLAGVPANPAVLAFGRTLAARLSGGGMTREEARAGLEKWREMVHEADPGEAAAALIAFLQNGEDAPTGLGFLVGAEGVLDEAPSLRTAALDLLAQTDPRAALEASRSFAETAKTPDELALLLRNVAWLNRNGAEDAWLAAQFRRMLDEEGWLTTPTTGFLEAFDVAVAVGGPEVWRDLGSVLRMEGAETHPVNQAAFVALDRLMLRQPEVLVQLLQSDPHWLDWAPDHRASLLSRLDVRAGPQRELLQQYLLSLSADPDLALYFASLFPNRNAFSGYRLVTTTEGTAGSAAQDQATLAQVQLWLQDPGMQAAWPALRVVESRLLELEEASGR